MPCFDKWLVQQFGGDRTFKNIQCMAVFQTVNHERDNVDSGGDIYFLQNLK